MNGHTRRRFLQTATSTLVGGALSGAPQDLWARAGAATPSFAPPGHLPKKLSICSWQWAWVASSLPQEPYGDLERVMVELKERNFNTIRIDACLHWCFRADGTPRGAVEVRQVIEGYSSRLRVVNCRGGGRPDVLKRLIHLMELARKHDVFVVLTDWEYMHTTWFVADRKLRAEIEGIPKQERLFRLVGHMDRLVRILKEKDLAGHIAYIEPHNEVDYSSLPKGDEGKRLHTEAITFLRERHPDILVSGDFGKKDVSTMPDNTQIYDHHIYVGGALYHGEVFNKTVFAPDFDPHHPKKNKLLKLLLEDNIVPYDEFMAHTTIAGQSWAARMWLYHNLNIAQFDRWILDKYAEHETKLKQNARTLYAFHAREAAKRNLPVVVEEGGFWYGPLNSRWEESETGLAFYDFLTDLAIEHDFWGFLPTTYNGPEIPIWWANPGWLKENNRRFLQGVMSG